MTTVRKGQAPGKLSRDEFGRRFREAFYDPAYRAHDDALRALEELAWDAYREGRKAPLTEKAGPGFSDPGYDLSVEWRETRERIQAANTKREDPATPSRVLIVCGSSRNDGTCPGEVSKTWRLAKAVEEALAAAAVSTDFLDLSLVTSDPMRHIHPCKGCLSTAMPLCHWPCSCYPNHATRQIHDWMGFIDAGFAARLDRYIGYFEPYATSHESLDADTPLWEEVRNVARSVAFAVGEARADRLSNPAARVRNPRPK